MLLMNIRHRVILNSLTWKGWVVYIKCYLYWFHSIMYFDEIDKNCCYRWDAFILHLVGYKVFTAASMRVSKIKNMTQSSLPSYSCSCSRLLRYSLLRLYLYNLENCRRHKILPLFTSLFCSHLRCLAVLVFSSVALVISNRMHITCALNHNCFKSCLSWSFCQENKTVTHTALQPCQKRKKNEIVIVYLSVDIT